MSTATRLSVPLEPTDSAFIDYLIENPQILNLTGPRQPSRGRIVREALRALQKQIERQEQDAINERLYAEMAEEYNAREQTLRPARRRRLGAIHAES